MLHKQLDNRTEIIKLEKHCILDIFLEIYRFFVTRRL